MTWLVVAGIGVVAAILRAWANRRESAAYIEGRNIAIDNAAMKAYDMGHPDVREAINALVDRGVQ